MHEMKAVAEISNLKLAEVCLLHLVFELYSGCTAIVANSSKGPYLARTLDWDMDVLKQMTILVSFVRAGKCLFKAVTWAGYVGVLTGLTDGFGVAVNFRQPLCQSEQELSLSRGNSARLLPRAQRQATPGVAEALFPVGLLVRRVCETEDGFAAAVARLSSAPLWSGAFLIVTGIEPDEGVVLTRSSLAVDDVWQMNAAVKFLVQANLDRVLVEARNGRLRAVARDEMSSCERVQVVSDMFAGEVAEATEAWLWSVLHTHPVWDDGTVYGAVMRARDALIECKVMPAPAPASDERSVCCCCVL